MDVAVATCATLGSDPLWPTPHRNTLLRDTQSPSEAIGRKPEEDSSFSWSWLVSPNPATPVTDEVLEWAVRIALECRLRVKEQQKRIGSAEFRYTQFSYAIGDDGVEKFATTPEPFSENSI